MDFYNSIKPLLLVGTAKSLQTHGVNRTKDIQGLLDQLSHIK